MDTGFIKVGRDLLCSTRLTVQEKMVYCTLVAYVNRERVCFPSYRTIAKAAGCSCRTVQRSVERLIKAGLVEKCARYRENGGRTSNFYIVKGGS